MPLIRWVRDLGQPRVPGTYEVRNTIVRVTERDIIVAGEQLRGGPKDVIFVVESCEPSKPYRLGSIICTEAIVASQAYGHSVSDVA